MHLEGSIEPELLLATGRSQRMCGLRWETPEALRAAYEFQQPAIVPRSLLRRLPGADARSAISTQITRAYLRRAHADAVIRAEVFIGPQGFTERGVPIAVVMDGVLAAMRDAAREDGISAGLLVSAQRHRSEAEALELLDTVMPWADQIAGFGLGGAEVGNPPSRFVRYLPRLPRTWFPHHGACRRRGAGVLRARGASSCSHVDRIDHGNACLRRSGAGARTGRARQCR